MWGAGISVGAVCTVAIAILLSLINANTEGIQQTRKVVKAHERDVADSINAIDHTLTIISINQIRQMKQHGVDYIEPTDMILQTMQLSSDKMHEEE